MRLFEARQRRARSRGRAVAWLLAAAVVASPGGQTIRASSLGDAALEPGERGRVVLKAREAVLREQAERARWAARARGLALYRVLRFAAIERGPTAGEAGEAGDAGRLGGRAVVLGTAVLERDLAEARALRDEWERVRGLRCALESPATELDAAAAAKAAGTPVLHRPVGGAVTLPYGIARDTATGAWLFRSAMGLAARPEETVRSPVGGRVARVAQAPDGGQAVVLEAEAAGWIVIVSGFRNVMVTAGQTVRPGESLGAAGGREREGPTPIRLEVWRGRAPVDPSALFTAAGPTRVP